MKQFKEYIRKLFVLLCIAVVSLFAFVGCTDPTKPRSPSDAVDNSERPTEDEDSEQKENTKMYLTVNGHKLEVTLADTRAAAALVDILKQGDITYTANDYGGFEKVGSLGHDLPTDNSQITTQAGDIMLYLGNQIVVFYGSNTWSYTRLGRINGYSASELRAIFGEGSVQITLSLD